MIEGQTPTVLAFGMTTSTSETLRNDFDISVFPNPTSRFLQVALPHNLPSAVNIRMVNALGQVVYQQANFSGEQLAIDLDGLMGNFEVVIEGEGVLVSRKVLVF